jgi:hypothetical protein
MVKSKKESLKIIKKSSEYELFMLDGLPAYADMLREPS